ncbi:helix-turn-helix transcriptional regulator [Streptomyces sp. NBC_00878]|uniref:helix-turn-helix domain-containing protein n=1 Tax=Streptomyces sp. NBC_00878 TaxID=2975854 RepID=UPI002250B3B7|nr:helix-turn-helix transcriptional regulator [Streptomyces sp. NBC_00878]MCX4905685.1 helix-turn-helix domain-containing protein [Streptomyces sp. NBC_00878]
MGLRVNPTYRQRRFGAEVRAMREGAGFTAARAAGVMGMNASHISTVEAGRTALSADRLRRLAAASGGEDSTYVDALIELGATSGKGWWTEYRDRVRPSLLDLAELEDGAAEVVCYEPFFVPGLLQTESYASVIHRQGYAKARNAEHDLAVEFRVARQRILQGEHAPRVHAIVHEAALHPSYGDERVMREQLVRLIELSRLPHVTIQVLPFDGPVPFGTSFTTLLPPVKRLGTVIVAHVEQSLYLGDVEALARYTDLFARLRHAALPPMDVSVPPEGHLAKDSLGLIQRLPYPLL